MYSSFKAGFRLVTLLALAFCPHPAGAQTTYRVPQDVPTIQAAIDKSRDGDTVLVSPGSYTVSLDFEGKAVTLTTGATSYTQPVVAQTVLQANGVPVAVFYHGEGRGSVINGFTISDPSHPNVTYTFPGGYAIQTASVLDSLAGYDGIPNPLTPANASPTITNNRFIDDVDAIILSGPEIAGNYFSGCSGFAIITIGSFATAAQGALPSIHDNLFENNTAAIVVSSSGSIQDNLFQNNAVTLSLLEIEGSSQRSAVAQRNVFRNNTRAQSSLTRSSVVEIGAHTLLFNNLAYGNHVDALLVVSADGGSLNTVIAENTFAENGAAPGCQGTCPATQILLQEKGAFSGNGVLVANNIFQTPSPGPYIVCQDDAQSLQGDTFQVDHNLFSPTAALYDPTCRPQIVNAGNLSGDPAFVNPGANDFHLTAGSPAVDSGNNSLLQQIAVLGGSVLGGSLSTDLDKAPRPVDATRVGYPIIDMGAFERAGVADGAPTSLLLTPSSYAPNITQTIDFTAQLSSALGTPVGTVTFLENGKAVATAPVLSNGTATVALALNTQGAAEFLATYPGAYLFTPASSTKLVLEVALFPTYLTLTASPLAAVAGQPVTLSVTAGSTDKTVPSPIALTANGVALGTVLPDANGNASLTVTTLPPGKDTIVAAYAGDQHHGPSSATATVTVTLNDFALALNPPSVTVKAGLSGHVSVLLSSLGLFAGSLHLNAGNLPQYASATFAPDSVGLSGGGYTTAALTIDTSAAVRAFREPSSLQPPSPRGGPALPVFALLLLAPLALRRRRVRLAALGLLLLPALGCGDVYLPLAKVAPGTYTVPISAADPVTGVIHSTNLTLIVTP